MAISSAFREIRVTLAAGILTPVTPPAVFMVLGISNGTGGDLLIYTNDDLAQTEYRVLAAGYEREREAKTRHGYRHNEIACWLLSAGGGLVILEWS